MPVKPCGAVGCMVLVEVGQPYCDRHAADHDRARVRRSDQGRKERPSRKWYNSKAWKQRRADCLRREPLCRLCPDWSKQPSTVADHVIPHRDDHGLFWFGELQGLCKTCHDQKKQRIECRAAATPSARDL